MKQLYITSNEYDFLKTPHKIGSYKLMKINNKTCLYCKMDDAITVWSNDRLYVYSEVILVTRIWFTNRRLIKLDKFPIEVHIIDFKSIDKNSFKGAHNISWGCLTDMQSITKCLYS